MNSLKKLRPSSGEMVILIVIGVLALIIITGQHEVIFKALFSPTAVAIAIIMLVEYLILKGSDRAPIYRRELEAAREKRRDDLLTLRAIETSLVDLRARLDNDLQHADEPQRFVECAGQTRNVIEDILKRLRERI
ncbi:hypothetical protein LLG95_00300 [bacterium]|nr:hypothetical protein [bacterium]